MINRVAMENDMSMTSTRYDYQARQNGRCIHGAHAVIIEMSIDCLPLLCHKHFDVNVPGANASACSWSCHARYSTLTFS